MDVHPFEHIGIHEHIWYFTIFCNMLYIMYGYDVDLLYNVLLYIYITIYIYYYIYILLYIYYYIYIDIYIVIYSNI